MAALTASGDINVLSDDCPLAGDPDGLPSTPCGLQRLL